MLFCTHLKPNMKSSILTATLAAMLTATCQLLAVSTVTVGSTLGAPGSTVMVPVSLITDTNVTSLQFDLVYSTNNLAAGTATGGDALVDPSEIVGSNEVSPGLRRVLIASFVNIPVTNGVLAYIPFTIATNAPDHDEPLTLTNVLLVQASSAPVPSESVPGTLSVVAAPQLVAISQSADLHVHVQLLGTTGRSYTLQSSTDLTNPEWTTVDTKTAVGGTAEFEDATASGGNRFYRALVAQ